MPDDLRSEDVSENEVRARALFRDSVTTNARERLTRRSLATPMRQGGRRVAEEPDRKRGSADFLETKGWLQNRLLEEIGEKVEIGAGHVEIVGYKHVTPRKLLEILQRHGMLAPTPPERRAALDRLLAELY